MSTNNLLDRLIAFSNCVHLMLNELADRRYHKSLIEQLSRSTTSAALNYSEAIVTKSDKDYAFKVRIALKEMNESGTAIKILKGRTSDTNVDFNEIEKEAGSLMAILSACCRKAENKSNSSK